MRTVWLALAAMAMAAAARGESDAVLQVDYSNPGLTPSHWTMTLRPDGSGHFHSEHGDAARGASEEIMAPDVDRDIHVSAAFAERVFGVARQRRLFSRDCEIHQKVAFQGWKKLNYSGPEGQWGCQFNYAKDKEMETLGDSLVSVADMIVEGARLETLLAHDRLGLDREMEYVAEAAGDGRLREVGVIQGILERLSEDPEVMERVRKRAKLLLATAGSSEPVNQ
ncbi:MAG: hypothetical protein ABR956_15770 [Terracidiphilus sp.]|jgi:hypothetical protein